MTESLGSNFPWRHLGPRESDLSEMLKTLGCSDIDDLTAKAIPKNILDTIETNINPALDEQEFLQEAQEVFEENKTYTHYIGQGYYNCYTPGVIQRNILENPGWYTAYTPYQAEISQGRLEALLNYQTMITDLTGLDIANASLLDEATAAAEAMTMAFNVQRKNKSRKIFVDQNTFAQCLEVLNTRALPLNIEIVTGDFKSFDFEQTPVYAALLQYPNSTGEICDYKKFADKAHAADALVIAGADLMALTLIQSPGSWGADIAYGTTQRFGVPMGFGGPHAAYISTIDKFKRSLPGRIIGVSKDRYGRRGLRLALQTREQHIRRDKATSNICTSQVLLAVMASMYAVYHGPEGLKKIATEIHSKANLLAQGLTRLNYKILNTSYFDTLEIETDDKVREKIIKICDQYQINVFTNSNGNIRLSVDETTKVSEVHNLLYIFNFETALDFSVSELNVSSALPSHLNRNDDFLTHPVFNSYHSETEMLRYITRLQDKDLCLNKAMIPLGSCTMKLNATSEMVPVTWNSVNSIHPFAPMDQVQGYMKMIDETEEILARLTGFANVSFQPNAGSQGEYAGLLVIRKYQKDLGQEHRNICLIPSSAHGTNPASAVMAGLKVVVVACDDQGNIDVEDLKNKATEYKDNLSALMVTYPSTHGVFEDSIIEICKVIHDNGGQVYMDGANFNALVGVTRPGTFGPDVAHLNLHKTFSIPHGGGGPGIGPIAVCKHLSPYLPGHHVASEAFDKKAITAVSAAPWGSTSVLPISWGYMKMMGDLGLKLASQVAILNANYIAKRLEGHFDILYKGQGGWVAHECIIDTRPFKESADVSVDDIAKRLIDYGFHAPTMSWPVTGTLMIEPTESESKEEIDRFCDALIAIRKEISEIENGDFEKGNNVLSNAPHSIYESTKDEWDHKYSRSKACYPLPWVKEHKFWTPVDRIDNVYGDKNLVCSCPSIEEYQ